MKVICNLKNIIAEVPIHANGIFKLEFRYVIKKFKLKKIIQLNTFEFRMYKNQII